MSTPPILFRLGCASLLLSISCATKQAVPSEHPTGEHATADASSSAEPPSEEDDDVSASARAAVIDHLKSSSASSSEAYKPGTPIALEGLFEKSAAKADFPKKTASDRDCYRTVGISGKADKDYDAILAACGAPTGMKEWTKRVTGKLDAKNPRDTYAIKLRGGLCYRVYAIGDTSLGNLDIRVQRTTGALLSMDQSKQAIAILDPEEPWCKTHDRELHFIVETTGGAGGNYVFGVWARPK